MTEPTIRPALPSDLPRLREICILTAAPQLQSIKDKRIIPAIWCDPYILLSSGQGFVLESVDSGVVGYILFTLDTDKFIKEYEEKYIPSLAGQYPVAGTPDGDTYTTEKLAGHPWILSGLRDPNSEMRSELIDEGYRPHLHIDLLPAWQGQGFGVKLLEKFEDLVKVNYCRGYHLRMDEANDRAGVWYDRRGLVRREVAAGGRWMVKDF